MLGINSEPRVLDLGCGIGRWVKLLMPQYKFYCSIDISDQMIKIAKETCKEIGDNFDVRCMTLLDVVKQEPVFWYGRFDLVISAGVLCI